MEKNQKLGLALAGIFGIGILGVALANRKAGATGGGTSNSGLTLTIIPAHLYAARSFPAVAPATLLAGSNGNTMQVTITNNTVYTGTTTKAPYTFKLHGQLVAYGQIVVNADQSVALGPGEVKNISWTFGVPLAWASSDNYAATAWLASTDDLTPIGTQVQVIGAITPAPVTPGGSISF